MSTQTQEIDILTVISVDGFATRDEIFDAYPNVPETQLAGRVVARIEAGEITEDDEGNLALTQKGKDLLALMQQ